jgi:type II secretory pathway pseudopilin PulG
MMVALLVAMSIAAIWMAALFPKWGQQAQREKEDDLIFRGEQYARAIVLYQNKNRNLPPPDIDTLISQHFLRKKWKDPITGKDFTLVGPGIISTTQPTATAPGQSAFNMPSTTGQVNVGSNQQPGITGVRSTSTATSIKIYNNQQQHNLWQFDAATYRVLHGMAQAPTGAGQNGGRQGGGRDSGPGGARGGPGGLQPTGPGRGAPGSPPPVPVGGRGRGF